MGMISEFKEFAMEGNMVDMAVGIIIGAALGKIISSLVDDIIMPVIGSLMGGVDFSSLFYSLSGGSYASLDAAKEAGALTINYGNFIQTSIDFVIIAFVIFLMIKGINSMKKEAKEAEPSPVPVEQVILTEIRDLLKK